MADPTAPLPCAYFRPRPLDNLTLVDELDSLCPIIDSKVMNMLPNSDTPQLFAAWGRGARSTFRTLRHGLEVEEVVSSDLPGIPNAVWTTKLKEDGEHTYAIAFTSSDHGLLDPYDSYIILSFVNGTLVLCMVRRSKKCKTLASSLPPQPSLCNKLAQTRYCRFTLTVSAMSFRIGA